MVSLRVPGKINLDLRIGSLRGDGFHPLSSWFVTVGLFDELTIDTYPMPGIHFSCDDPTLAVDGRNLVVRAASDLLLVLGEDDPVRKTGLAISLTKRIPTGGGLGGGSADAAYTLLGVAKVLELCISQAQLAKQAALLGSDVAFFLRGASALCTGRGEVVDPLPTPMPKGALLALPSVRMPTPAVYKEFDRMGLGSDLLTRVEERSRWHEAAFLPALDLLPLLVNDLEAPAFGLAPGLGELRQQLQNALARPVRMSGSGSTLFTLFDTLEEAEHAVKLVSASSRDDTQYLAVEMCPDHRPS